MRSGRARAPARPRFLTGRARRERRRPRGSWGEGGAPGGSASLIVREAGRAGVGVGGPACRWVAAQGPAQSGAASGEPGSGPGASRPPARPPLPRDARPSPLLPSRWKVSRISSQQPLRFQHGGADGGGSRLQRGFLQGTGRGAAGDGSWALGAGSRGAGDPGGRGEVSGGGGGGSWAVLLASALGAV
jgi:hypothetical protein